MYANQQTQPTDQSSGIVGNRPQTTLESAVGSSHATAAKLAQAIDMLEARLQAVMAPAVPKPAEPNQTHGLTMVETPHSPVVNDLHALCGRLQSLAAQVGDIVGRLEA